MAQQLASNPPDTNGISILPGVTQAQFLDYVERHRELSRAVAQASQDRKDFLTKVKTEFGRPGYRAFLSTLRASEQPGEDREVEHLSFRQLMTWLNKPVGWQASLFGADDQNVVALSTPTLRTVDGEGYAAGKAGKRRESNPYTPGTEAADRFDAAWLRGQSEIASTLAPDADQGERRRGRRPGTRNRTPEEKAADLEREARRLRGDDVEEEVAPEQVH